MFYGILQHVERTTIILEKPLLDRVRLQASRQGRTLKDTLREIIIRGMHQPNNKEAAYPIDVKPMKMGHEKMDLSNRARLYELLDES